MDGPWTVRGRSADVRGRSADVRGRSADFRGRPRTVRRRPRRRRGGSADVRGFPQTVCGRSAEGLRTCTDGPAVGLRISVDVNRLSADGPRTSTDSPFTSADGSRRADVQRLSWTVRGHPRTPADGPRTGHPRTVHWGWEAPMRMRSSQGTPPGENVPLGAPSELSWSSPCDSAMFSGAPKNQ